MDAAIKRFLLGSGSGYGDGSGDGSGYGERLVQFSGKPVFYVDSIPCVFVSVHDAWAAVLIINRNDFTSKPAFIARQDGFFAHGETIREAFAAVTEKVMDNMDFDEKKKSFVEKFPSLTDDYPTMDFFSWHHVVTGSCDLGRKSFANEKGIDLSGMMTVSRFFELTRNAYGGERIKELEEAYN
jgi:hypothetical protein